MADSFKVVYLKSVREKTSESYLQSREKGLQEQFVKAAATIDKELRNDPRGFGDPCFSLADMELGYFRSGHSSLARLLRSASNRPVVFVNKLEVLTE
jgi:hypothetical protein